MLGEHLQLAEVLVGSGRAFFIQSEKGDNFGDTMAHSQVVLQLQPSL